MNHPHAAVSGWARIAALAAASALAVTGFTMVSAVADPETPGPDGATDMRTRIAELEVQISRDSVNARQAQTIAEVAAEDYNHAHDEYDTAQEEAREAQQLADTAGKKYEVARQELAALARSAYRQGPGELALAEAMLKEGGLNDVVTRTRVIEKLGTKAESTLQRYDAAKLTADTLQASADKAAAQKKRALEQISTTKDDAAQAAQDATAQLNQTEQRRTAAINELAALKQTTPAAERQRIEVQESAAAERVNEEAKAERVGGEAPKPPASQKPKEKESTPAPAPSTKPSPKPSSKPSATSKPTPKPTSTPKPSTPSAGKSSTAQGKAAVSWARNQIGKPYGWGASGPSSFDCSGLTSQAWLKGAGFNITRSSRSQYQAVTKISYNNMRPGDLIFWATNTSKSSTIHHVAIYAGNGQMVEAPNPGKTVRLTSVRWSNTMPYAGRV